MKARVKSKEELLKWFKDNDWSDTGGGYVYSYMDLWDGFFDYSMFEYCEQLVDIDVISNEKEYDYNSVGFCWKEEWLNIITEEEEKEETTIQNKTTIREANYILVYDNTEITFFKTLAEVSDYITSVMSDISDYEWSSDELSEYALFDSTGKLLEWDEYFETSTQTTMYPIIKEENNGTN